MELEPRRGKKGLNQEWTRRGTNNIFRTTKHTKHTEKTKNQEWTRRGTNSNFKTTKHTKHTKHTETEDGVELEPRMGIFSGNGVIVSG